MKRGWIQLTIFYFLLTAVSGVLMRSSALLSWPSFDYSHFLHAHSHLALLGWVYMALFLLFLEWFTNESEVNRLQLKWLYGLTQLTVMGIFISFSLQGYAFFSILFSTLQILLSYWFVGWAWKQLNRKSNGNRLRQASHLFVKGSLVCLVVSSAGPWMLAYLSANDLKEIPLYDAAIYFYLHFQYNGWFTLGLFGILLRILEKRQINVSNKTIKLVFRLYVGSLLPAFLLSVLWLQPGIGWTILAVIAAIVQWLSIILYVNVLIRLRSSLKRVFEGWARLLLILAMAIAGVKATLELGSALPALTALIYNSRSVVIGYLHLTLLGFVSLLCLALFLHLGWLNGRSRWSQIGLAIFLLGFGMNELVLFLEGLFDWRGLGALAYSQEWLWAASMGMAIGIGMLRTKGNRGRKSRDESFT
jgi:hypothetical protein